MRVARLGASGRHPQNSERDFHRKCSPQILEPTNVNVTMNFPEDGVVATQLPLFMPHELLACVHRAGALERIFLGQVGLSGLKGFWDTLTAAGEKWVLEHPVVSDPSRDRSFAVPLFVHADETESHNDEKMWLVTLSGITHAAPAKCRLLMACIPSDLCVIRNKRNVTLAQVLRRIKSSLELCHNGLTPQGHPLCPPFFGVFCGLKGDLQFQQQACWWDRWYSCTSICRHCRAENKEGPLLWTDLDGAWQDDPQPLQPKGGLAGLRGFTPRTTWDDPFHLLFVQGTGNDLVASCLIMLSEHQVFSGGSNHATNRTDFFDAELKLAYRHYRAWCRAEKVQTKASLFTLKSLHHQQSNDPPYLGGKGADVRLVLLWLAQLLPTLAVEADSAWFATLHICVAHLANFSFGLSHYGVLLDTEQARDLRTNGQGFVRTYLLLAGWAISCNKVVFKVRPKLHYCWHLASTICCFSPKLISCMTDESFMGCIGRLANQVNRRTLSLRVLQRYQHTLAEVLQG